MQHGAALLKALLPQITEALEEDGSPAALHLKGAFEKLCTQEKNFFLTGKRPTVGITAAEAAALRSILARAEGAGEPAPRKSGFTLPGKPAAPQPRRIAVPEPVYEEEEEVAEEETDDQAEEQQHEELPVEEEVQAAPAPQPARTFKPKQTKPTKPAKKLDSDELIRQRTLAASRSPGYRPPPSEALYELQAQTYAAATLEKALRNHTSNRETRSERG